MERDRGEVLQHTRYQGAKTLLPIPHAVCRVGPTSGPQAVPCHHPCCSRRALDLEVRFIYSSLAWGLTQKAKHSLIQCGWPSSKSLAISFVSSPALRTSQAMHTRRGSSSMGCTTSCLSVPCKIFQAAPCHCLRCSRCTLDSEVRFIYSSLALAWGLTQKAKHSLIRCGWPLLKSSAISFASLPAPRTSRATRTRCRSSSMGCTTSCLSVPHKVPRAAPCHCPRCSRRALDSEVRFIHSSLARGLTQKVKGSLIRCGWPSWKSLAISFVSLPAPRTSRAMHTRHRSSSTGCTTSCSSVPRKVPQAVPCHHPRCSRRARGQGCGCYESTTRLARLERLRISGVRVFSS
jgi:hypothetical protein